MTWYLGVGRSWCGLSTALESSNPSLSRGEMSLALMTYESPKLSSPRQSSVNQLNFPTITVSQVDVN